MFVVRALLQRDEATKGHRRMPSEPSEALGLAEVQDRVKSAILELLEPNYGAYNAPLTAMRGRQRLRPLETFHRAAICVRCRNDPSKQSRA